MKKIFKFVKELFFNIARILWIISGVILVVIMYNLILVKIFGLQITHFTANPTPTLVPTSVPTPEVDRFDFRLEYPEGVPSQGIDITIEGDLLSLMNTSLSANNAEISAGQPGSYHIDPSKIKDNHVNITISSFSRISKSFSHAAVSDTDYYTFTVFPD